MQFKPYEVIEDEEECQRCGSGQTWTIRQPDGVCIGSTFIEEADADELCQLLNHAFHLGQQNVLDDQKEKA